MTNNYDNLSDEELEELEPTDSRYLDVVDELIEERIAQKRSVRDGEESD